MKKKCKFKKENLSVGPRLLSATRRSNCDVRLGASSAHPSLRAPPPPPGRLRHRLTQLRAPPASDATQPPSHPFLMCSLGAKTLIAPEVCTGVAAVPTEAICFLDSLEKRRCGSAQWHAGGHADRNRRGDERRCSVELLTAVAHASTPGISCSVAKVAPARVRLRRNFREYK